MQAGNLIAVRSRKGVDFIGAVAQNAAGYANIKLPGNEKGPARGRVRSLTIIAKEALAFEVQFFSRAAFQVPGDLDTDSFLGYWAFAATDGVRIGGANSYYAYVDGLDIAVYDDDDTGSLHLALVNRSAGAKSAGAAGEIVVQIGFEPTLGF